jgi:uncharacterized protein YndB with AHSA1/START domain
VFDAWLSPELLGRWVFGAKVPDEEILRLAVDRRVGGSFSFLGRSQGEEIDHVGRYLEIDRPHRLVSSRGESAPATAAASSSRSIPPGPDAS